MKEIQEFFSNIKNTFPTITVVDILDILLVAFLIYQVINLIRSTSAYRIARAIILLLALTLITDLLNLHTLNYLLDRILELGVVALVIVFQPELRRFLERIGGRSVRGLIGIGANPDDQLKDAIEETVKACGAMAKERVGALIVFERENSLEQISNTGTKVDAAVSQELIRNIFFPKAALHDGAMIINAGRIESAGCVLPLSENRNLSTDLGTRHRAGVGMSESNDSLVIIVSEETGTISVAVEGMLKRPLTVETLRKLLMQQLIGEEKKSSVLDKIKSYTKGGGKNDQRS
ncbi:MAG: diadenylate cyclase CdaA [Oscillospiraceae bacterium]|nr:diadenylate cyclase CdaA [Oscillospiraceae bacterium]